MAVDPDLEELFRASGLRVTGPRRRVVAAVQSLDHATAESVSAAVAADGGEELPLSTIYRNLDTLEQLGLLTHTHLTHGVLTYHIASRSGHLHLVCRGCDAVLDAPLAAATELAGNLQESFGFVTDVRHLTVHGWCASCAANGAAGDARVERAAAHSAEHPDESTPEVRP